MKQWSIPWGRGVPLGSLNSLLSCAPQLSELILFPVHLKECRWLLLAFRLVQFWRPEVTDGWQPCLLIQREVFSFHMCKCLYTAKHVLSNYFYLKRVSDFHRCNPFPCLHPSLWLSSFSSSLPASCISVSDKHWSGSAPVVLSENYIRAWSQDTSGSCVSDEKADQEVV